MLLLGGRRKISEQVLPAAESGMSKLKIDDTEGDTLPMQKVSAQSLSYLIAPFFAKLTVVGCTSDSRWLR